MLCVLDVVLDNLNGLRQTDRQTYSENIINTLSSTAVYESLPSGYFMGTWRSHGVYLTTVVQQLSVPNVED